MSFCKFYSRKYDGPTEILKRLPATPIKYYYKKSKLDHWTNLLTLVHSRAEQKETKKVDKEIKAADSENSGDVKKGAEAAVEAKKDKTKELEKPKEEEKKEEPVSTPLYGRPAQNWSDLFFILDSLSYNIDMCDLILFMTKMSPIPGLENKKVSVDVSYLDTISNTLIVSTTDAGIIESILGKC